MGSEMCIRDRLSAGEVVTFVQRALHAPSEIWPPRSPLALVHLGGSPVHLLEWACSTLATMASATALLCCALFGLPQVCSASFWSFDCAECLRDSAQMRRRQLAIRPYAGWLVAALQYKSVFSFLRP